MGGYNVTMFASKPRVPELVLTPVNIAVAVEDDVAGMGKVFVVNLGGFLFMLSRKLSFEIVA